MPHNLAPSANHPSSILVAEDEPKLSSLLADYLTAEGFGVRVLADGAHVVEAVHEDRPDLMLLDLMLPGKNGLDICREVRAFSSVPIIMITARVGEIDRLLGLELGADDYICKPFSPREVVARVKAILRRAATQHSAVPRPDLTIDNDGFQAFFRGAALDLTPAEFRMLRLFAANPGKVFSRERLLTALYDDHRVVTDRTVDTHVKNLRRKLQQAAPGSEPIVSIYGVGYKFLL